MKNNELEITICKNKMTQLLGVEVGVRIHHIHTNIVVESTAKKTQHLNKLAALVMLEEQLNRK